jgi:ABC-type Fe3+/spermidine/putrescine transport system ATPase subunit
MGVLLRGVSKSYGAVQVLQPTDLDVGEGEFLTILGPSGSGKTTILRMIGGFTAPSSGRILYGTADITDIPTHRRPFNTVFQDYALFPHLSVAENVAYGLRVRGTGRSAARARAAETLEMVGLGGMMDRMPGQLSGGQRQRVALARAIVCEPRLILLDEPLSALDAGLRRHMQGFLKDLQRRLATTFLFVTHDQEEAITMSDRIVVMSNGRIEQIGSPRDLYYAPRTAFVARFFGDNNLAEGRIEGGRLVCAWGDIPLPSVVSARPRPVLAALRPERIGLGPGPCTIGARLTEATFAGAATHLRARLADGSELSLKLPSSLGAALPEPCSEVELGFDPADVAILQTGT